MQRHWLVLAVGSFTLLSGCGTDSPFSPRTGRSVSNARGGSPDPTASFSAGANSATEIGSSWLDGSPSESGWEIHRSTNGATGNFTLRATLAANSTGHTDVGLTPLTEYCYRVRSFRKSGPKTTYAAFFNTSCATTYGPPPAASVLNATPRDLNAVDIVWTDNSSTETGFRLERGEAVEGPWTTVSTLSANTTSSPESGRPAEQLLCYRVIAVNQWGEAASNVDCTAHTAAPSNVAAVSNDPQSIDVTWDDNAAFEDGYEVSRSGGGSTVVTNLGADVTSFHDTNVLHETLYWYYVRAKRDGNGSSSSAASAVISTGPPTAPNVDAVPYGSTAVAVYWAATSATTEGGRIERKTNGVWTTVSGPAPNPTFSDEGRTAEQEVCYRAIAYNTKFGDSPLSGEDCTTPPAAPTNVTVTPVDDYTSQATWTDNSSVEDAYELTLYWYYCWDGWYCDEGFYTIWTEPNAPSWQFANYEYLVGIAAVNDGGYSDPGTGPAFGTGAAVASVRAAPKMGSRPAAIAPTGRPAKLNGIARSAKKPTAQIRR